MAANICFTKIRPRSKFSPPRTIVEGGCSCSSSAQADEQTNYTHLPSPGCCWSQRRCGVCGAIRIPDLMQLVRIAGTSRRRWPCDTAGLQSPLYHTCQARGTRSPTSCMSLAPLKQPKALSPAAQLPFNRAHTRAASLKYLQALVSLPPTRFPYALIYTSLKASF